MRNLINKHVKIRVNDKNADLNKAIMESKYLQFVKTIY